MISLTEHVDWVLRQRRLPSASRLILLAVGRLLHSHRADRSSDLEIAVGELAAYVGIPERTLFRNLRTLKKRNLIVSFGWGWLALGGSPRRK